MNDNLDDFLNSLGITQDVTESMESPAVHDPVRSAVANGDLPPEEPAPYSLADDELDSILSNLGFQDAPEEPAEEESEEEEEGNTEGPLYVGEGLMAQVQQQTDISPNLDEGSGFRDLDAEEDADWQEAIDSGSVVPVVEPSYMVDSDNRAYVIDPGNGQRVYLHSEAVDAVNSRSDSVASNILAANRELVASEEQTTQAQQPETTPASQEEPLIPLNSPTLLMDESTTRFSGAEWFNEIQRKRIIIAGCGGIGSNLAFQLARMKPEAMYLYDDDMVEAVNMAGQLYARNDVGKSKVTAISDMITSYTNMQNVYAIQDRFTEHTEAGDIMMCGFDNMEARKTFFGKWLEHVEAKPTEEQKNCLFLDGRLSIDCLQVLCITGDDRFNINRYRSEFLFSDEEAEHTVCSMKQTTYLACMIGSFMVNLFTNWCAGLLDPIIPYDLPFFTEYDAQNMIFKTVN